jgi:hypothetical protein
MDEFKTPRQRFQVITHEPSPVFTDALAVIGVQVEGWTRHHGRFRSSNRYTQKLAKGFWVRPGDMAGDLELSYSGDPWDVFDQILTLAEANGIYMANGGMVRR